MRGGLNCNFNIKIGENKYIKAITTAAFTLLISVSVMADGHKKLNTCEGKSSDPMISLHPTANQTAAADYCKAVEKMFKGAIPQKYA